MSATPTHGIVAVTTMKQIGVANRKMSERNRGSQMKLNGDIINV